MVTESDVNAETNVERNKMSKEELIELLTQQSKQFHPDYEHSIKLGFDIAVMMVKELLELEVEE